MSLLPSGVMETPTNAYFVKTDLSNDNILQTQPQTLSIPAGGGSVSSTLGTLTFKPGKYLIVMPFKVNLTAGNVSATDYFNVYVLGQITPTPVQLASSTVPPGTVATGSGWYGSVSYVATLSGTKTLTARVTQYNTSSTLAYTVDYNYVTFQYLGPA